jgi:Flp pilus assembly protein TadG
VAILVALVLPVLLGFTALAVDFGHARQQRAQAQNSADFAALAGAGVLKTGTIAQATTEAETYAEKNGFVDRQVNIPPSSGLRLGDSKCVEVITSSASPAVFGALFGVDVFNVAARATACATPAIGGAYSVFAGTTTCTNSLNFSGANRTINGNVHTNNDVHITSSGTVINGEATYLTGSMPTGNITYNPSIDNPRKLGEPLPYPDNFNIADYAPGGAKALLALSQLKYHYAGSADINLTWLTLNLAYNPLTKTIAPGLYYTSGNIDLSGNGYNAAGATFVTSNGIIHFNGNSYNFSSWDPDGLLLFSNKSDTTCATNQAVIKLNGNTHFWSGIMFAPNGPIDFAGTNSGASLEGRLVANTVNLSGSNQVLSRNDAWPGRPAGFELVE